MLDLEAIIVYIQISREPGGVVKQPGGGIRMVSVACSITAQVSHFAVMGFLCLCRFYLMERCGESATGGYNDSDTYRSRPCELHM